jgi:hypothetical protein
MNKFNVKHKNFTIMKKQLFSLLMMLALVVVAGSAMAQTNVAPYANGTTMYSYTWSGVTPITTTHGFFVLSAAPTATPTSSTATAAHYDIGAGADAPTPDGGTATVKITWNNASNGGTYYVAFVATNATCTNFRYIQVLPKAPVDFTIYAVGVTGQPNGTDLTLNTTTADGDASCAPELRVGADYLSGSGTEGNGSVYVFFRVDRLNGTIANDWTADITTTASSGGITELRYSTNGTDWTTSLTNAADNNVLYVRALIPIPTNVTAVTVSSSIVQATTFETLAAGGTAVDYEATNNGPKTYIVSPVPTIGSFN